MKLGFIARNDLAGVEEDAIFASENGFTGLEFNYWKQFEDLTADTVKKTREILERHGVEASALGLWGWNHISPDAAERRTSLSIYRARSSSRRPWARAYSSPAAGTCRRRRSTRRRPSSPR